MSATDGRHKSADMLVWVGLFVYSSLTIGFNSAEFLKLGPVSAAFILVTALSLLGWLSMGHMPVVRIYLALAVSLTVWMLIASIHAWDQALVRWIPVAIWIAFNVPGLASLFQLASNRNAVIAGQLAAASTYVVVAVGRLVTRGSVFDLAGSTLSEKILLSDRNRISALILTTIPLLFLRSTPSWWRLIRWPFVAGSVLVVAYSNSRSGIIAMLLIPLVIAALQPTSARRLRTLMAVLLVAGLGTLVFLQLPGNPAQTTERFISLSSSSPRPGDEARRLLQRKAYYLTLENPVFGIGTGNFRGRYHPVILEGSTPLVRELALTYIEHNAYLEVSAGSGLPALLLFLLLLGWTFTRLVRRHTDRDCRMLVASLTVLTANMLYFSGLGDGLYVLFALGLAATGAAVPQDSMLPAGASGPRELAR